MMTTSPRKIRAVHHRDMDGLVSALVLADHHRDGDLEVRFVGYDEVEDAVADALEAEPDVFYLSDLSLPPGSPVISRVGNRAAGVRALWFDHHQTSDPGAMDAFDDGCLTADRLCTADIVARHLEPSTDWVVRLVELAHDRDLWINDQPDSRSFEMAVMVFGVEATYDLLTPFIGVSSVDVFGTEQLGPSLAEAKGRLEASLSMASRTLQVRTVDKRLWGVAWVQGFGNEVAESLMGSQGLDAIVMVDVNQLGSRVPISLRTCRSDLDVSEFAKMTGGGGHRAAAGSDLDAGRLADWLVRVVGLGPLSD